MTVWPRELYTWELPPRENIKFHSAMHNPHPHPTSSSHHKCCLFTKLKFMIKILDVDLTHGVFSVRSLEMLALAMFLKCNQQRCWKEIDLKRDQFSQIDDLKGRSTHLVSMRYTVYGSFRISVYRFSESIIDMIIIFNRLPSGKYWTFFASASSPMKSAMLHLSFQACALSCQR